MDLGGLSVLAQLGHDPQTEAARLAELPRAAAADRSEPAIARLPACNQSNMHPKVTASCLAPLPPDQDHPVPDNLADAGRLDGGTRVMLLTGAMLGAALALGLLAGAAFWGNSHAGPPDASPGVAGTGGPSAVGQPGHHGADPGRPAQVRPAVVRAA